MTAPIATCFSHDACGFEGEAPAFIGPGGVTVCPQCDTALPRLRSITREHFLLQHIASELAGVTGPLTGLHALAIYQLLQREGFIPTGGNANLDDALHDKAS